MKQCIHVWEQSPMNLDRAHQWCATCKRDAQGRILEYAVPVKTYRDPSSEESSRVAS